MGLYSGRLIIGRIFASEIWEAYFREGLFFERAYIFCLFVCLGGEAYYRNFRYTRTISPLSVGIKRWMFASASVNDC